MLNGMGSSENRPRLTDFFLKVWCDAPSAVSPLLYRRMGVLLAKYAAIGGGKPPQKGSFFGAIS
jgi:hypothetical protein